MAAQKHWKAMALLIICIVLVIVWIFSIVEDFQADQVQRAQHECKSNATNCDPNAHCYGNENFYECICKFGWVGDALIGDGHLGCHKRPLPKLLLVGYIIETILIILVILWFLVDAIQDCIKLRTKIQNQIQVVPLARIPIGPIVEV